MSHRARLIAVIVLSLVIGAAWVSAQFTVPERIDPPIMLSGNDVGFRVEARHGDTMVGHLLVRIDGKWIEADLAGGPLRARTH